MHYALTSEYAHKSLFKITTVLLFLLVYLPSCGKHESGNNTQETPTLQKAIEQFKSAIQEPNARVKILEDNLSAKISKGKLDVYFYEDKAHRDAMKEGSMWHAPVKTATYKGWYLFVIFGHGIDKNLKKKVNKALFHLPF